MKQRGRKSAAQLAIVPASPTHQLCPPAPDHLQPTTQQWWADIVAAWPIEPHQFRTLQCACEAWDHGQQAREALTRHGLTYTDHKGMIRSRPEVQIERDSRIAFLRAMRELNLVVAPPKDLKRNSVPWQR